MPDDKIETAKDATANKSHSEDLEMEDLKQSLDIPNTDLAPSCILVIAAHPDDIDFGAGGTVAKWTAAGSRVVYCLATDGDAGGFDVTVPRSQIPLIRRAEQAAAAGVVGVGEIYWLGYPDGRLEVTMELRRDIARVIRIVRPDRVLVQNPERNWERVYASHPDHMAAGEAALRAVYPDARNPFAFLELLSEGHEAHTVPEVWVMGAQDADEFVDITDTFALKLEALRQHVSQETDKDGQLEQRLRQWLNGASERSGLAPGRLVESFRRVVTG